MVFIEGHKKKSTELYLYLLVQYKNDKNCIFSYSNYSMVLVRTGTLWDFLTKAGMMYMG